MKRTFTRSNKVDAPKIAYTNFIVTARNGNGAIGFKSAKGNSVQTKPAAGVAGIDTALAVTRGAVEKLDKCANPRIYTVESVRTFISLVAKIKELGKDPSEVLAQMLDDAEAIIAAGFSTKMNSEKWITEHRFVPSDERELLGQTWDACPEAEKTDPNALPADMFADVAVA